MNENEPRAKCGARFTRSSTAKPDQPDGYEVWATSEATRDDQTKAVTTACLMRTAMRQELGLDKPKDIRLDKPDASPTRRDAAVDEAIAKLAGIPLEPPRHQEVAGLRAYGEDEE
jgi:hypothetical protein